jgi:hypothetical protein
MKLLPLLLLLFVAGCDQNIDVILPADPTPIATVNVFEYRVTGNAQQARIRYSNPIDGTNQITTALPFFTSFKTDRDSLFLSLDATPINFSFNVTQPFPSVQIFVNGVLFQQSSSTEFNETVSASGSWRR